MTIVGIDLGTATSEIACIANGRPTRLRDIANAPHGFLPSIVGFDPDGHLAVGSAAEQLLIPFPSRAVAEVKRLMGSDSRPQLAGEEFSPQEISAIILRHLKSEAERALGVSITEAVITVPAYFTNMQRQATRDAGELAGLRVRRLVNEPTAAALAYGLDRPNAEEKIVVYDLGGGTFDVTVLELSEGVIDVLASTGNAQLGGKEFDERLMSRIADVCKSKTGIDLESTPGFKQRLKGAAKRAKEELSTADRAYVSLDNLALRADGAPINFTHAVTRAEFESQIDDLVSSTSVQLEEALTAKQVSTREISTVLLVGGSTRVPLVRKFVAAYFPHSTIRTDIDPDEAVALGAAVLAGMESSEIDPSKLVVTDVSAHTLGVAIMREGPGGESESGYFDALIDKQSTIPRTARKRYVTASDQQDSVRVQVFQGDSERCADNTPVGDFTLDGLPPEPAGYPIEIEFSYNLSGELVVTARAPGANLEKKVHMRPSRTHLSTSEKDVARTRIDRLWSEPLRGGVENHTAVDSSEPRWRTARQYSRVAALMTHAERRLPTLDSAAAAKVAPLVKLMRQALEMDDEKGVELAERTLTDLLFDLS